MLAAHCGAPGDSDLGPSGRVAEIHGSFLIQAPRPEALLPAPDGVGRFVIRATHEPGVGVPSSRSLATAAREASESLSEATDGACVTVHATTKEPFSRSDRMVLCVIARKETCKRTCAHMRTRCSPYQFTDTALRRGSGSPAVCTPPTGSCRDPSPYLRGRLPTMLLATRAGPRNPHGPAHTGRRR